MSPKCLCNYKIITFNYVKVHSIFIKKKTEQQSLRNKKDNEIKRKHCFIAIPHVIDVLKDVQYIYTPRKQKKKTENEEKTLNDYPSITNLPAQALPAQNTRGC